MELLLNVAWLLLVLPAYWLFRRDAHTRAARRITSLQSLLALGCVLVLLFPVISASDDLHVMRAEMEESSTSKQAVRQATAEKNSSWVNRLETPSAIVASTGWLAVSELGRLEVSSVTVSPPAGADDFHAGRAPPFSLLA
jgi:hypothetical protein